jgi:hypothetical protein
MRSYHGPSPPRYVNGDGPTVNDLLLAHRKISARAQNEIAFVPALLPMTVVVSVSRMHLPTLLLHGR